MSTSLASTRGSSPVYALFLASLLLCQQSLAVTPLVCPKIGQTDDSFELQAEDENGPNFSEVSGLALSSSQTGPSGEPVMYVVNDSGGGKRLGVFDSGSGNRLLTLTIKSLPSAFDWESLGFGSCGIHGETDSCIYIGDIGDNTARIEGGTRSGREGNPYRIYKIREPDISEYDDNDNIPKKDTFVLEYDYSHPTSPTEFSDSEAIFLDHKGWGEGGRQGDIYVVTKWEYPDSIDKTRLFQIPATAWDDSSENPYAPVAVGECPSGGDYYGKTWTMADMNLDGTLIAIGDNRDTYLFPRCPGVSVAEAVTGDAMACLDWDHSLSGRTETFSFTPDGNKTLIMSERDTCDQRGPPMSWTAMDYSESAAEIIECEETQAPSVAASEPNVCPTIPPITLAPTPTPEFPEAFELLKCEYLGCLEKYSKKFNYAPGGFGRAMLSIAKDKALNAIKKMETLGDVIPAIKRMRVSLKKFQQYREKAIRKERVDAQTYCDCVGNVGTKCTLDLLDSLIDALEGKDELISDRDLDKSENFLKQARNSQREGDWKTATSKAMYGVRRILGKLGDQFIGAPVC